MELSYTLKEISKIATAVLKASPSKTVLFYGNMGAGKTTLIKELVHQLGSKDQVSSPTFSLVNEYRGKEDLIYHFDFYRIEQEEEAYDIGFEEYLDSEHWKFIEWPEKIAGLLPDSFTKITLETLEIDRRRIVINKS